MDSKPCQSCGMTIDHKKLYGTNKNGTINTEYCKYCYSNGEFNKPDETFSEMVESCIPFEVEAEGYTEDEARIVLTEKLKPLKRWS
ncbi:zinc ribbon domain-containing protein [Haloplasma contractile]|uniref:Transcriptional regulator protein n=1 Tax=Haloplasma contractile SSD-17B TaxID=1033810 RepID=F7Q0W3_9MOLU|nr:zinc ribbon domain-containing protein [Haloplasma contractile]ERJ11338.1 Transcriptional regulator protein [Haloplasma contractile SSD-17B]